MVEDKDTNDFEIGDVESFISGKDEQFSHSSLVMSIMRKCLDNGAEEMRAGYYQKKVDVRGNEITTYIEDTRRKFIASVQTAIDIMICDFDKDAKDKINVLLDSIKEKTKEFSEENTKLWNELPNDLKIRNPHIDGFITHPFLQDLMTEFQLDAHRKILRELTNLTSRIDFYKAERFEA
jgi:hypothetical protein